jgi:hypothetical protein
VLRVGTEEIAVEPARGHVILAGRGGHVWNGAVVAVHGRVEATHDGPFRSSRRRIVAGDGPLIIFTHDLPLERRLARSAAIDLAGIVVYTLAAAAFIAVCAA